ncbi:YheC/YheD family protein [Neobacillus pocheonensis]|uniref:YheC/YheD family protein n=1 Tax=Neobacillus pocheonensis TaxID=363869 RepID=A0ABT0W776_9BACI|nr:YheC/YheD family protein [Neobacillus pocheonensis]
MITIGMLHYRKDPVKLFKTYMYAAAAKMEGVNFFYFTPSRVNLEQKRIRGVFYENGKWIEREVGYPDVVFNAGGTITTKQDEIVDALQKEIPFTSHPIGDKMSVYKRIKKSGQFTQYLIPSEELVRVTTVFLYLNKYKSIIIKPVSGAKGEGIIYIEKQDKNFFLKTDEMELHFSEQELKEWIAELLLLDEMYLIQPFIQSKTKTGLPFDFRLHVQKNEQGKWVITTIYPRIANSGVVSNISLGGYTSYLPGFLKQQFDEEFYNVQRYLEVFAIQFSTHFDSLYDEPLDELGIDVGMDENKKIWIYEVNWRPGTPVLFYLEMDVAKRTIEYAVYLAQQSRKVR